MELVVTEFKNSIAGKIPQDWAVVRLGDIANIVGGSTPKTGDHRFWNGNINWFTPTEIGMQKYVSESKRKISELGLNNCSAKILPIGTILLTSRAGIGDLAILTVEACTNQGFQSIIPSDDVDGEFLYYLMSTKKGDLLRNASGSTFLEISPSKVRAINLPLPTLSEQTAIATALSDMDALISSLEDLIEKKRMIKQGAMQELLKPKEGWVVKRLGEIVDVLDNLRRPLNEAERLSIKGDIPYCGANGIIGYVNDYLIDDDIILMAEDGGYFDEYKTRPIAYRVKGKVWVNNHAHIIKAKLGIDQIFLFYSLVNKNILDYISGGTRAKLNKGQLLNITVAVSTSYNEQNSIATIISDMDNEISTLKLKLEKYRKVKFGMIQNLLTGKIRLV